MMETWDPCAACKPGVGGGLGWPWDGNRAGVEGGEAWGVTEGESKENGASSISEDDGSSSRSL